MPSDTFKRFKPGDRVSADNINSYHPGLRRTVIGGNGVQVQAIGNELVIEGSTTRFIPRSPFIFCLVVAEFADYVTATIQEPASGATGAVISVAKPGWLQRTPFDNLSITLPGTGVTGYVYSQHWQRVATSGTSETQIVTPRYWVGDQLRAIRGNVGFVDGGALPVLYQDINTAARVWAVP